MEPAVTYRELLVQCEKELAASGVPDAAWDAWLILSECFGLDRTAYFLKKDIPVCPDETAGKRFCHMTEQRKRRVPFQYLLGRQEFMGLSFAVTPSVLIPRADTETLVEAVLKDREGRQGGRLLDLCTGSGCIAVSLAHYGGFEADGTDLSADALHVARQNAAENGTKVRFLEGDLFDALAGERTLYDVIVSNPPYIAADVLSTLEPEVREFEPRMALEGGKDGLDFYRRIASGASGYLKPAGRLYLEIGYDQAEAVSALLREKGYRELSVRKDLAGNDRVVSCLRPEPCIKEENPYV